MWEFSGANPCSQKPTYNQLYSNKKFFLKTCISLYDQPSTCMHMYPWIQPTGDHAVLSHVFIGKKSTYKLICAVKTLVVQGSTVYCFLRSKPTLTFNFFMLFILLRKLTVIILFWISC